MSKLKPRYYQQEFFDAVTQAWKEQGAWDEAKQKWENERVPYANCCPASGKSLMLAMLSEWALKNNGRVLQLVPKLEHVTQNYNEMVEYSDHKTDIGICCAKLNKAELHKKCLIATASSFVNKRSQAGKVNLLLIDELHNVSNDPDSRYRKIVRSLRRLNPRMYIAGVSGTPYRTGQGMMHESNYIGEALFTDMVYETSIKDMIKQGYLSHIENISGDIHINTDDLKITGNDYDTGLMSVRFDQICDHAVSDIQDKIIAHDIKTGIIFASSVANAKSIADKWSNQDEIKVLHGEVSAGERTRIINWLETGQGRRFVVNPNILCEGYDFKALGLVVLMRSTISVGLYVQMVCRVIRAHEDKEHGFLADYGTNIERLGAIDNITPPKPKKKRGEPPRKLCTATLPNGDTCNHPNPLPLKKCQKCQAEFVLDPERPGEYSMRTKAMVLSESEMTYEIVDIEVEKAYSKKTGDAMIKMFMYGGDGFELIHTHYLCLNHKGYAKDKADRFVMALFKEQSTFYELGTVGTSVDNVMKLMMPDMYDNFFKKIVEIKLSGDGKFKDLVGLELK